jgi:hypothetical protein
MIGVHHLHICRPSTIMMQSAGDYDQQRRVPRGAVLQEKCIRTTIDSRREPF